MKNKVKLITYLSIVLNLLFIISITFFIVLSIKNHKEQMSDKSNALYLFIPLWLSAFLFMFMLAGGVALMNMNKILKSKMLKIISFYLILPIPFALANLVLIPLFIKNIDKHIKDNKKENITVDLNLV